MGSQFWWFYDALVIAGVLFIIFTNAKRGFRKNFIIMMGYIVSILMASIGSAMFSSPVYQYAVRSSNLDAFSSVIKEYDASKEIISCVEGAGYGVTLEPAKVKGYLSPAYSTFDQDIYRYVVHRSGYVVATPTEFRTLLRTNFTERFGQVVNKYLPSYARRFLEAQMEENPELYIEVMQVICSKANSDQIAEYLEDKLVKDGCLDVTSMFLFLAIFLLIMSFVAVFAKKMESRVNFNIHTSVDHIAGAVMGLIEALVMVCFVAVFLKLIFITTSTDLMVLNVETVEHTKLFRYFYQLDNLL